MQFFNVCSFTQNNALSGLNGIELRRLLITVVLWQQYCNESRRLEFIIYLLAVSTFFIISSFV